MSISKMTVELDKRVDAFWLARALEHFADTHCVTAQLKHAKEHCQDMAVRFRALDRTYNQGWLAHDDCMTAIEEAAGFSPYTLRRL